MKDMSKELREDFSGAEIKMKIEKKTSEEKRRKKRKRKEKRKKAVKEKLRSQGCS